jgi:hypothetical protein
MQFYILDSANFFPSILLVLFEKYFGDNFPPDFSRKEFFYKYHFRENQTYED